MDKILQSVTENDVIKSTNDTFLNLSISEYNDRLITRIHNKYYDLTDFIHPGGPVAISLAIGRDGSELFESHHLYSKIDIQKILSKFEMFNPPVQEINSSNVYDWDLTKSSDFTKELKQMAKEEIGSEIKCTWSRLFELIVISIVTLSQVIQFYQGYWHTLITLPLAYWVLVVNSFHDASHFGLSWNWRINRLATNVGVCFCPPYTWYHQHVIGHHIH
jgi:delta11-fatty-acid desaturase